MSYLSDDEASIQLVVLVTVRVRIIVVSHFILLELTANAGQLINYSTIN